MCTDAEVAQLVEHHLAKVRVAGSSLVFRSLTKKSKPYGLDFLFHITSYHLKVATGNG